MGHDILIRFSEGRSNLGKVKNRHLPWDRFVARFENPTRTRETYAAYSKFPVSEKLKLKSGDGFFFAAPCRDGSRKKEDVLDRDILTIDIDENAHGLLESYEDGTSGISKYVFMAHTTRSHSPENPKCRTIIPLARQLLPKEHAALSRIVSSLISPDMEMIDPVSHRLAQMMFKPTCSKDSEYILIKNDDDDRIVLDPDAVFDKFRETVGDPFDFSLLPTKASEKELRDTLQKAEDPTSKVGPVGVWCRAWPMEDLLDELLSDYYTSADHSGTDVRYTPVGSTGASGIVIYDEGKFMFSHHSNDPCSEMLVNAWDAARLCLFGDEDVDVQSGTKLANLPSSKSMLEFAKTNDRYQDQQITENFDMEAMLDDDDDDDPDFDMGEDEPEEPQSEVADAIDDLIGAAPTSAKKKASRQVAKDWIKELETDKNGDILTSYPNCIRIVTNDKRWRGKLAYNELEGEIVQIGNIKTKNPYINQLTMQKSGADGGEIWTDLHDATIRGIIAEPNGPGKSGFGADMPERTLREAIVVVAQGNPFHPVRDFLDEVGESWDGKKRICEIGPKFLGTPADAYHTEVFMNTLVAAVARIYEPGHKFDNMMILEGKQGARKSTLVEVLAMRKWYLELTADLSDSKAVAEATRGAWIVEMAEMVAHNKAESDMTKSWLSRRDEKVRMAYARKSILIRRQFIPIGTTNLTEYLKDPTGARRYWPVRITVSKIDIDGLEAIMSQIWAEAVVQYRQMRKDKPQGDLWLDLHDDESVAIHDQITKAATATTPEEELSGQIEEWLNTPVPLTQVVSDEDGLAGDEYDRLVYRTKVCVQQVHAEVLGNNKSALKNESMFISRAMLMCPSLSRAGGKTRFARGIGRQRAFRYDREDFSVEDMIRGYSFADGEADDFDDLI